MFVIAMHQPGVTVRPLVDMTGRTPFNEVYLDEARVGPDGVIGEVGQGWAAAVTMLGHERVTISGLRQRRSAGLSFAALAGLARLRENLGEPAVREALADLYVQERVLELFNARMREETAAGRPPGARGSVGKLAGVLLLRQAVEVAGEVAGLDAAASADDAGDDHAWGITSAPASGIAGGTNTC